MLYAGFEAHFHSYFHYEEIEEYLLHHDLYRYFSLYQILISKKCNRISYTIVSV